MLGLKTELSRPMKLQSSWQAGDGDTWHVVPPGKWPQKGQLQSDASSP